MKHLHRILLVDDEPEVTRSLKTALRKEPWDIETADSGEQALDLMDDQEFDVIVSDERMPGIRGADLLGQVRDRFPGTIRVMLSGTIDLQKAVDLVNDAAIDRLLLKPTPPEEVSLIVHEALARREERTQIARWRAEREQADQAELNAHFDCALEGLWMGFQPVVRAYDKEVFGYEALVRSDDPELQFPDALFMAAHQLERYDELAERIFGRIEEAIPQLPTNTSLLVNIDPRQLNAEVLHDESRGFARNAERIVLEITEREQLRSSAELEQRLDQLRSLGYRIAIDDLGAGYAGLTSFAVMCPDIIKLDMELIRGIDQSRTKQELVKSLARVAKELEIQTIAEGIETRDESYTVRKLGCDLLQGYLFGAARPGFDETQRSAA